MTDSPEFRFMGLRVTFDPHPILMQTLKEIKEDMITRAELTQAISSLDGKIAKEADEIKAVVAALQAKIDELSVPADFSEELAKLNSVTANLEALAPSAPEAPVTPAIIEEAVATPPEQLPVDETPVVVDEAVAEAAAAE